MKFYSSVRLDTRRKEILPENKGIRIKVKIVKNKVAAPFQTVFLDLIFGSGIDRVGCMLDAALNLDIVERRGSWYAYNGKQLAQGRDNVISLLKEDTEVAEDMENEVRFALSNSGEQSADDLNDTDDDESTVEASLGIEDVAYE